MGRYVSDANVVLFIGESGTYAATSGAGQWVGMVQENNIDDNENVQQIRYLGTSTRNVDAQVSTSLDHTGTFSYYPQDWKFLALTLGSNVDAGSPSPYTHTISEANSSSRNAFTSGALNPFISFTLEETQVQGDTGANFKRTVAGAIVNNFTISASQGEIIKVDVDYVAQSVTYASGAATAVTAITTRPFLWSDVIVNLPTSTALNTVNDVSVSINNNVQGKHYLNGSRVSSIPVPQNRDYSISLTLDGNGTDNKTLYDNYFRGGSVFNMNIAITDVSAGAGSRDMTMYFSGCRITDMEAPTNKTGEVNQQTITIVPLTANALVNDTTQYYGYW